MTGTRQIVYLNGEYSDIADARISVLDRGFLFGDGVYEVIPVFGNRPLRCDDHLRRLQHSLDRISLNNPMDDDAWKREFDRLLEKNPGEDRAIYLQVSRGACPVRDLSIKPDYPPTVFMMVLAVNRIDLETVSAGICAITIEDFRWDACDIKSTSLVANVMLKQQAAVAGVDDAILVKHGYVTEGTASNVFLVKDNSLVTPQTGHKLLSGITREMVIDIAEENRIPVIQRPIKQDELFLADEIWLTSSTREIAPVVRLDDRIISKGVAGPMWKRMMEWYQQQKRFRGNND